MKRMGDTLAHYGDLPEAIIGNLGTSLEANSKNGYTVLDVSSQKINPEVGIEGSNRILENNFTMRDNSGVPSRTEMYFSPEIGGLDNINFVGYSKIIYDIPNPIMVSYKGNSCAIYLAPNGDKEELTFSSVRIPDNIDSMSILYLNEEFTENGVVVIDKGGVYIPKSDESMTTYFNVRNGELITRGDGGRLNSSLFNPITEESINVNNLYRDLSGDATIIKFDSGNPYLLTPKGFEFNNQTYHEVMDKLTRHNVIFGSETRVIDYI